MGHVVGQGKVKPVDAKVKFISDFPRPESKKQLMRFLGMAGYYRKFCRNFSTVAESLTHFLSKKAKFLWNNFFAVDVIFRGFVLREIHARISRSALFRVSLYGQKLEE